MRSRRIRSVVPPQRRRGFMAGGPSNSARKSVYIYVVTSRLLAFDFSRGIVKFLYTYSQLSAHAIFQSMRLSVECYFNRSHASFVRAHVASEDGAMPRGRVKAFNLYRRGIVFAQAESLGCIVLSKYLWWRESRGALAFRV